MFRKLLQLLDFRFTHKPLTSCFLQEYITHYEVFFLEYHSATTNYHYSSIKNNNLARKVTFEDIKMCKKQTKNGIDYL